jgi:hypothetical protein
VASPWRTGSPLALSMDVPRAGAARLEIFSVTGQRVRTLFDGAVAAGTLRLSWDTRGRDGAAAPPGLYFAVLRSGGLEVRRRIVMLR